MCKACIKQLIPNIGNWSNMCSSKSSRRLMFHEWMVFTNCTSLFSRSNRVNIIELTLVRVFFHSCREVLSSSPLVLELNYADYLSPPPPLVLSSQVFFFFSTSARTEIHRQSSSPLLLLQWNCVDSSLLLCSLLELNCVIHDCIWIPSLSSKCLFSKPVHYYLEKNACGLSLMLLSMWQPLSVLLFIVGSSFILC